MSALRDKFAIVGTGKSRLGRLAGVSALGLLAEAIENALDEAGLTNKDVDGLVCRGPDDLYAHHQMMGARLGINAAFSTTLDNGGASQILAVILAVMAIIPGLRPRWCAASAATAGRAPACRSRRTCRTSWCRAATSARHGIEFGHIGAVAAHGLGARRHMFEYGTTREDFAAVAMAFREHALRNPDAMMKTAALARGLHGGAHDCRSVRSLRLHLMSDGAGAVIMTSAERARALKARPVLIKGFATFNNTKGWHVDDHMVTTSGEESAHAPIGWRGSGRRTSTPSSSTIASLTWCWLRWRITASAEGRERPLCALRCVGDRRRAAGQYIGRSAFRGACRGDAAARGRGPPIAGCLRTGPTGPRRRDRTR